MVSLPARLGLTAVAVLLSAYGRAPERPGAHDREFRFRLAGADELTWCGGGASTSRDAAEIAAFIDLFHFEDEPPTDRCPCSSEIDFSLSRGGRPVMGLGFFRGRSVRGVPWGSDMRTEAALTDESALRVCRWFADRAPERAAILQHYMDQIEFDRTRERRTRELLPHDARSELAAVPRDCNEGRNEAAILRRRIPDDEARAMFALRLVACLSTAGYCGAIETLDQMPVQELLDVLRRAQSDAETAHGADCWILRHDRNRSRPIDPSILDEFLRPAAERLLADSGYMARDWAIYGLRDTDHPDAVALLRGLLGSPDPRVRSQAAKILVNDKEDQASFERIRELAPQLDEQFRDLIVERMERIEGRNEK